MYKYKEKHLPFELRERFSGMTVGKGKGGGEYHHSEVNKK